MIKLRRLIIGVITAAALVIGVNSTSAFAMLQSQSVPSAQWNLISLGEYSSSAYTNGYRLYTNYYFIGNLSRCRFYGTSSNASSGYYIGVINYNTGYTYLNYRGAGTSTYDIWIDDTNPYPIGDKYFCGFNMTANSSSASNYFGVGSY